MSVPPLILRYGCPRSRRPLLILRSGRPRSRRQRCTARTVDHRTCATWPRLSIAGCARGRCSRTCRGDSSSRSTTGGGTSRRRTRTCAGRRRTGCWWPGSDTGLRVAAAEAVDALLDAAEAFLALRAADGGTAWRAVELAGAPTRIGTALAGSGWRGAAGSCRESHVHDVWRPERGFQDNPAARPGPVRRDDGGLALVVAPLLGELTVAQVRLLADLPGPTAVVTPWRTVVLPEPRRRRRGAGRRGTARRAGSGRRRQRLCGAAGLREGPRRRPRRRARRAQPASRRPTPRLRLRTALRSTPRRARRRRRARRGRVPRRWRPRPGLAP